MEPSVLVDGGSGCLGHLVIALHNVIAAGDKLTDHLVRTVFSGFGIDDLALDLREGRSDGGHADLQRIGGTAHGAAGGRFCLSVYDNDLGHVHLVDDVTHDGDGAGASCHDAGTHEAEIRLFEIRMLQHGNEHGGHAVEGGDMFVVDAGQRRFRREIGDRKDRPAVGHGGRHGKNHTKTMEHGYLDHHPVLGG